MSWLFSQALVEVYSEESCSDGEQFAQLNVMPSPQPFWRNDRTIDVLSRSPFGLTWKPLTEDRGKALLMLFLEDFRAKTSQPQESRQVSKVQRADFGSKCLGLFAKWDQASCSWRTPQILLLGDLEQFLETWPRWGTMQGGESLELTGPGPLTKEKGSGSWPTPIANDAKKATLPPAEEFRDSIPGEMLRRYGPQIREMGSLNPNWVEWLMGWPTGWTDCEPLEMDKFQEWLNSHGTY